MNWTKDYQRDYKHKAPTKKTPATKYSIVFYGDDGQMYYVEREAYSIHHAMNEFSEDFLEGLQELLDEVKPKEVKVIDELLKETHIFKLDEVSGCYCWECEEVDELMKGDE